jgi:hypothetical protein
MRRLRDRLPDPQTLRRRAPAIAGFAFGVLLPLVLAGTVSAARHGGLSDNAGRALPVDWIVPAG